MTNNNTPATATPETPEIILRNYLSDVDGLGNILGSGVAKKAAYLEISKWQAVTGITGAELKNAAIAYRIIAKSAEVHKKAASARAKAEALYAEDDARFSKYESYKDAEAPDKTIEAARLEWEAVKAEAEKAEDIANKYDALTEMVDKYLPGVKMSDWHKNAVARGLTVQGTRLLNLFRECVLGEVNAADADGDILGMAWKSCRDFERNETPLNRAARRKALCDLLAWYGGHKIAKLNGEEADFLARRLSPSVSFKCVNTAHGKTEKPVYHFAMIDSERAFARLLYTAVIMKLDGIKFTPANVAALPRKKK